MITTAPATVAATRRNLHLVAEHVVAPLRVQATGNEIALTPRRGGFGTPELPGGGWVGVDGTDVVAVDADGVARRAALSTLRAAGEFVGLRGAQALAADALVIDQQAATLLADVFARGEELLGQLIVEAATDDAVSEIHLWPEHFDIAIEHGAEAPGCRATYGISPGDDRHDLPYAYVAPWVPPPHGELWQATGFDGAELPYERLDETLDFWRRRRDWLASHRR